MGELGDRARSPARRSARQRASLAIMRSSPDIAAATPRGVRPGSSARRGPPGAARCSSIGISLSSPESWTSIAWSIASRPMRGSGLPLLSLIELIAEPARKSTFWAIPFDSTSWRLRMMFPWSSAPARVIIVGLMPAIGRVSASSEAFHSAPYGRM